MKGIGVPSDWKQVLKKELELFCDSVLALILALFFQETSILCKEVPAY